MISATGNKAFSLLELIIAVAILSIGVIVVLQAISFSARATGVSCDMINAVFLAQDKLQELELRENQGFLREENAKDTLDKFTWEYSITADRDLDLFKVAMDLNWQRANRQENLNINTYLRQ